MKTIGIIGHGNMGSAITHRVKDKYRVFIFDKDKEKIGNLSKVGVSHNIEHLLGEAKVLIIAVKPHDFPEVLSDIKKEAKAKLIISIAAGIPTSFIEKRLKKARVIRVMPNLPAKIGKGMICLCRGKFASNQDLSFAKKLFKPLGRVLVLKEKMMDAATAVSGSGPGFFYDQITGKSDCEIKKYVENIFIPSMVLAAESIGFSAPQAKILAKTTANGSLLFLKKSGHTPKDLKNKVASKGGTTEAGLIALDNSGSLEEAVKAALSRAKELS